MSLTLAPLETRFLPDVVASQFGVTDVFGDLRLDTTGGPAPILRMTSRTYGQQGSRRFGTAISGFGDAPASDSSRFVTGLNQSSDYRAALGVVNTDDKSQDFSITLRGPDGAILAESPAVTLPASGQWQVGIATLFPSIEGSGLTAEFQSPPGSRGPFAYGTMVDNRSGDLTYYPSSASSTTVYLPVISRVTGLDSALFQSELSLFNASDSSSDVVLTFLERERDNTVGAPTVSATLGPRETRFVPDALQVLFGLSQTYGALKVESANPLVVSARIYATSKATQGTVGEQICPVAPGGFVTRASILGLRQDDASRSNVGLFNPGPAAVNVTLTLRRPSGEVLGTIAAALPPYGLTQRSLAVLFPSVQFPPGEPLTLAIDAGSSPVAAYGIVVDNATQDLTASPALP